MPRGRPPVSKVRQRLAELLFVAGKLTAYEAYKLYKKFFVPTSQRNIYYQLSRGASLGQFFKEEVQEQGEFSWGGLVRKVYYGLARKEGVDLNQDIASYFQTSTLGKNNTKEEEYEND